jgi:hypothetical protein
VSLSAEWPKLVLQLLFSYVYVAVGPPPRGRHGSRGGEDTVGEGVDGVGDVSGEQANRQETSVLCIKAGRARIIAYIEISVGQAAERRRTSPGKVTWLAGSGAVFPAPILCSFSSPSVVGHRR